MSTLPLFHWLSSTASQGSNSFIFSRNVNTSTFPLAFKHGISGFKFFHLQQKCQHFHFSIGFQARHLRVRILSSSVEMSTLPLFHWLSSTASQGSNSFIFNRNVNTSTFPLAFKHGISGFEFFHLQQKCQHFHFSIGLQARHLGVRILYLQQKCQHFHFSIGFQARHLRVRILSSSTEMSTLPLFHWPSKARLLRVRILSSSVEMSTLPLFHWPSSTSSRGSNSLSSTEMSTLPLFHWLSSTASQGSNSFIFNRNVNTSTFPLAFKHGIS